ncbi:prepilin-type N-terminal cleavage/methylation domain-containing protein [Alginatibacterium sediminis]|uniref:Prepilin-type N-terminal cleavage/methylation domain-containing protein n=1 Tax=Alginatibacterium sediminis TaxID=2164068 RepID=A0A420EKZ8_9ALTE|nr:prepilin-type N-terminal cleavage/methylation domain-containing protein [Alginatibacterium sediminis]RKF21368.1 prepilin-type N-terminal cleavage/methylation domain-containing protein [Alginatibacterium sediminis]
MKSTKGFTLVELVIVIVILGVIVIGVSNFTGYGIQVYTDNTAIERTLAQSRFSIERMTRDIRSAVPNSIRISGGGRCLELIPMSNAGSYIEAPFFPTTANSMHVFSSSVPLVGEFVSIGARSDAELYLSQAGASARFEVLSVANASADVFELEIGSPGAFISESDRNRYYMFERAITYCVLNNGELMLYQNYAWQNASTPSEGALGQGILMSENIINVDVFAARESSLVGAALVVLQPEFEVLGESFRYNHQVQVVNAP